MEIIITLENKSDFEQKVVLLNALFDCGKINGGLPDSISAKVRINKAEGFIDMDYTNILNQIIFVPLIVGFTKTTNNRQLNIFMYNRHGLKYPIEPYLTISKQPRAKVKNEIGEMVWKTKWNPERWNVADTGELFILDGKQIIELTIFPRQKFEIYFDSPERFKIQQTNVENLLKTSKYGN